MTYSQNISRLKTSGRARLAERQQNNINRAAWDGETLTKQADSLAAFSKTLGDSLVSWKENQIEKDELWGRRQHQKDEAERVTAEARMSQLELKQANINKERKAQEKAVFEQEKRFRLDFRKDQNREKLKQEIAVVRQMDIDYNSAANELQEIKGVLSGKSEADRLRLMSPHRQVGYVKEKLRVFKEALPDKVTRTLLTSETPIHLEGIKPFTAKELTENNIHSLPMKEAAVTALTDQIVEAAGVYGYSDEMLELAGVHDAIQKVKDDQMKKYRKNYNIDASDKQKVEAAMEFANAENPDGDDVYLLWLKMKGTTSEDGTVGLTNAQAWGEVHKVLVKNANHNPNYADKISNMPLPEALRIKLGAKPGTTYGKQWPTRMSTLKSDIKNGYKESVAAEKAYLEAAGDDLTNKTIAQQRKTGEEFTQTQLNQIAAEYGKLGLKVPDSILNYNSEAARDYARDKRELDIIKGLNGGGLYPRDLQKRHPKLVGELMKEALEFQKLEVGKKGSWGSKAYDEIGGSLGVTFKSEGQDNVTQRKNPTFAHAQDLAFRDFQKRYLAARAKGMTGEEAYDHVMTKGPKPILGDLDKGTPTLGIGGSQYILSSKGRIAQGRTEAKELTERLDNVNEARQEIQPHLNNAEVYLRTDVLDGSEPYLTVLTDALANGKPIYGLRASAEVEKAMAYYNGVAYSYPGFTGIQLLNWQIKAAKMHADAKKTNNKKGVEE